MCHVKVDLLVRAAFKVVPLELAMSSIFLISIVLSGWCYLSELRLVIFTGIQSPTERQNGCTNLL